MAKKSGGQGAQDAAWRVDGIAADDAAAAEQAAAREGLSLGAWLSRLIRETAARERAERTKTRAGQG